MDDKKGSRPIRRKIPQPWGAPSQTSNTNPNEDKTRAAEPYQNAQRSPHGDDGLEGSTQNVQTWAFLSASAQVVRTPADTGVTSE
jgi:hypothetical protein